MDLKWSKNGLWLLTASRDHLVKLFDIRNMKEEVQVFKGHKKEATGIFLLRIPTPNKRDSWYLHFSVKNSHTQ